MQGYAPNLPGQAAHHVVQAQHVHAAELQHVGQRVADDGGAQVAHVHLLGHVGRGEVHHRARVAQARRPRLDALQVSRLRASGPATELKHRWPTCIFLATLRNEKSTTARA